MKKYAFFALLLISFSEKIIFSAYAVKSNCILKKRPQFSIFNTSQSVQVNVCQKLLFLHQLTHNMTTDCSLFMKIVSSEYLQNMLCTQIVVFVLFWHSEQFWYTTCSADVASFWKRFTCMSFWFLNLAHRIEKNHLRSYVS